MHPEHKPVYLAVAAFSGMLFGAGLYVAQMTNPLVVLRFLDFGAFFNGGWDPSLGFVIVSAIAVMMVGVRIAARRSAPLFENKFYLPEFTDIDRPLVIGGVLFGIGWGMSGICPGPAITLIGFMPENLWIFLSTMFAGSYLGHFALVALRGGKVPVPAE
ncbi:MAG TPA: DUF6691 family protein [Devosiaceae bacterium]|nr:DUF6691 family protein [Devosiaceae bacterium]